MLGKGTRYEYHEFDLQARRLCSWFCNVEDADLVSNTNDVHTTGNTNIACFQALMTCWNGGIRATGGLIAPEKTRWYLIAFI